MNTKKNNMYKTYRENYDDMILRDYLAVDRTLLANERTYLSYLRTSVSFIVAGLTLLKAIGGVTGIIITVILFISAIYTWYRGNKVFKSVNNKLDLS